MLILFFVLLFGFVAIIAVFWATMPLCLINFAVILICTVTIGQFIKGQGTDHQRESIELLIPWENISGARLDKELSGAVIIRVKKFRHQGEHYEGGLFFDPSAGADSLLNTLQEHDVKCKR